MDQKLEHDWCERNKRPILEILQQVLPSRGRLLEIGSGSGQHATFFAEHLPEWTWLPSDVEEKNLASVRAWAAEKQLPNLLEPVSIDVLDAPWNVGPVDALFSSNLIHIAPWSCCLDLMAGAHRHVEAGGLLILYGPFRIAGEHTADSNAAFDKKIRERDARFGVRDLEAVCEAAEGFELLERFEMPANNQVVVLRRLGAFTLFCRWVARRCTVAVLGDSRLQKLNLRFPSMEAKNGQRASQERENQQNETLNQREKEEESRQTGGKGVELACPHPDFLDGN